jgi:hypothetical protein
MQLIDDFWEGLNFNIVHKLILLWKKSHKLKCQKYIEAYKARFKEIKMEFGTFSP